MSATCRVNNFHTNHHCRRLPFWPNWPNVGPAEGRTQMHIMSAKDAKYGFDRLIDMADLNEVGGETKHEEVAA